MKPEKRVRRLRPDVEQDSKRKPGAKRLTLERKKTRELKRVKRIGENAGLS